MADENVITGKEILVFLDPAGGTAFGKLIVCLNSNSFNRSASVIDATSKCGTKKLNGEKERSLEIEGNIVYIPGTDAISEGDLNDLFEDDQEVGWKWARAIPEDGDDIYTGVGIISKLTASAPKDGVATFSATIEINGVPTHDVVAKPPAPTNGIVDDTANTFGFTLAAGFLLADHEKSLDGGTTWSATANPITGLTSTHAIGSVQVRVKEIGVNPASDVLSNATAFS